MPRVRGLSQTWGREIGSEHDNSVAKILLGSTASCVELHSVDDRSVFLGAANAALFNTMFPATATTLHTSRRGRHSFLTSEQLALIALPVPTSLPSPNIASVSGTSSSRPVSNQRKIMPKPHASSETSAGHGASYRDACTRPGVAKALSKGSPAGKFRVTGCDVQGRRGAGKNRRDVRR